MNRNWVERIKKDRGRNRRQTGRKEGGGRDRGTEGRKRESKRGMGRLEKKVAS